VVLLVLSFLVLRETLFGFGIFVVWGFWGVVGFVLCFVLVGFFKSPYEDLVPTETLPLR